MCAFTVSVVLKLSINLSVLLSVKLNSTGIDPVLISNSSLIELVEGTPDALSSNMVKVPRLDAELVLNVYSIITLSLLSHKNSMPVVCATLDAVAVKETSCDGLGNASA